MGHYHHKSEYLLTSSVLKKKNAHIFDCCLPMKIMKLVMKKPIQTHVIIGTFWGVEHLTLRSSQVQPVISFCKSFFYLAFGRSKDSVGFFLSFCNAASKTAGNQSKWNVEKGLPKKSSLGFSADKLIGMNGLINVPNLCQYQCEFSLKLSHWNGV